MSAPLENPVRYRRDPSTSSRSTMSATKASRNARSATPIRLAGGQHGPMFHESLTPWGNTAMKRSSATAARQSAVRDMALALTPRPCSTRTAGSCSPGVTSTGEITVDVRVAPPTCNVRVSTTTSSGSVVVGRPGGCEELVGGTVVEVVVGSTVPVPSPPRSEATSTISEITTTPPSTRPATIHLVGVEESDTHSLCGGHRRRSGVDRCPGVYGAPARAPRRRRS